MSWREVLQEGPKPNSVHEQVFSATLLLVSVCFFLFKDSWEHPAHVLIKSNRLFRGKPSDVLPRMRSVHQSWKLPMGSRESEPRKRNRCSLRSGEATEEGYPPKNRISKLWLCKKLHSRKLSEDNCATELEPNSSRGFSSIPLGRTKSFSHQLVLVVYAIHRTSSTTRAGV